MRHLPLLTFLALLTAPALYPQQPPRSTVIFYRQGGVWSKALDFPISLDGAAVGSIHNGIYFRVSTNPGRHEAVAGGSFLTQGDTVSLTTAPGQTYYVRVDNIKGLHEHVAMHLVNPAIAAKDVSRLKESQPRQLN